MHLNITKSEKGDNRGSSAELVHYLDKENRLKDLQIKEGWFNGNSTDIDPYQVKTQLDQNIAKLCKEDAKFFLVNISPSQKEIAHLKSKFPPDQVEQKLKAYAIKVMDQYALNFKKPGISSHKDLLWFGKLEHFRYYSHRDKEVKQGLRKAGERKPGEQLHLQVIVSRKDITNRIKLSPMNNSRGENLEHSKKVGEFNRKAFKASGEKVFDQMFGFQRGLKETFIYANTQKNGSLKEQVSMQTMLDQHKDQSLSHSDLSILLDLVLAKGAYSPISVQPGKRKRRKRRPSQNQQQNI